MKCGVTLSKAKLFKIRAAKQRDSIESIVCSATRYGTKMTHEERDISCAALHFCPSARKDGRRKEECKVLLRNHCDMTHIPIPAGGSRQCDSLQEIKNKKKMKYENKHIFRLQTIQLTQRERTTKNSVERRTHRAWQSTEPK